MRDKVLQSVLDSQRQRLRTREFFLKNACEVHGVPYDGGERVDGCVDVKEDQPPPAQDPSCSAPNRPSVPQAQWRQATRWIAGLAAASALGSGGYFAGNYSGDEIVPVVQPVEQPVEQQPKDLLQALESHGDHLHPEINRDD